MKKKTEIGIWNVRTLRETGKLRQAVTCMRNCGLNILGMSEVRWREFGEMTTHEGQNLYIMEGAKMIIPADKAWVY